MTCDPHDLADPRHHVIRYPALVVEVLSSSTALYDQSDTFDLYRHIPTLCRYALVDTVSGRWVEVRRKGASDAWSSMVYSVLPEMSGPPSSF